MQNFNDEEVEEMLEFQSQDATYHEDMAFVIRQLAADLARARDEAYQLNREIEWVSDSMPIDWADLIEGMPEQ